MRKVARGVSITVLSLMALVPIHASPVASAAGESLDVEPENVDRISNSQHRLVATVTPAAAGETVVFEDDDNPLTAPLRECTTDSSGQCSVKFTGEEEEFNIRAYVEDGPPDAFPCPATDPLTADADCAEGQDETTTPGDQPETPAPDDTDVVTVEFADGTLDVTPESPTPSFGTNTTVSLTATLRSTEAAGDTPRPLVGNVDAEVLPGSPNANKNGNPAVADTECTTDPTTGACDLTYMAGPNQGVDTVRSWVDNNDDPEPQPGEPTDPEPDGDEADTTHANFEGDAAETADEGTAGEPDRTDVVRVNISANPVLSLTPRTQNKQTGETVTITASVTQASTPLNNQKIAAVVLTGGPNAGKTAVCTTTTNGQCSLTYTGGATSGTDKIRATIDTDGNGQPNEADSSEDVDIGGGVQEPDTTDVVRVTWVGPVAPPPPDEEDDSRNQCDSTRTDAGSNEIVIGTSGNDRLCGFGGSDNLRGGKGNDRLIGGGGKDSLRGGSGNDRLKGGGGKDILRGGSGNDKVNGQAGKDIATGGAGKDRCKAEKEARSCEK